ncbi:MAG: AAA family ATPase [Gemmatimonadales bacterium]|nr:AAA family ATPase [Gemmatimonadales bacterium]
MSDFDGLPGIGAPETDATVRHFLTMEELEALPGIEWLAAPYLLRDSQAWLYAGPASFKTFVAIWLGMHVASGLPLMGEEVHQGAVLYVAAEGGRGIKGRLRAAANQLGLGAVPFYVLPRSVALNDPAQVAAILPEVELYAPALIVLDTYTRVTPGLDSSKQADFSAVLPVLDRLQRIHNSTILILDHANKVDAGGIGGLTGTIAKGGAGDTVLSLKREVGMMTATLRVEKQKDAEEAPPVDLELVKVGDSLAVTVPTGVNYCQRDVAVLEALAAILDDPAGATATTWRQSAGLAERSFYRARADLVRANLVEKRGSRYLPTVGGRAILAGRGLLPQLPSNCHPSDGSSSTTAANLPPLRRGGSGSDRDMGIAA